MSVREFAQYLLARILATRVKTQFGTTRIYEIVRDGNRMRVLDVNGTFQSAMFLDEARMCDPPFPYLAQFDCVFEREAPTLELCMLGGGGFAYPRHVLAHHPMASIDVIEIDPCMTDIAREHFCLDECIQRYCADDPDRLRIVCADAVHHLRDCAGAQRRYDAILNDCFAAGLPDAELQTEESARLIRACLRAEGAYVTNLVTALEGSQAAPLVDLTRALSTSFAHVLALPSKRVESDERDNVLVVATDADFAPRGSVRLYDAM